MFSQSGDKNVGNCGMQGDLCTPGRKAHCLPCRSRLSGSRVFLVRGEADCGVYQAVCLCGCGSFLLLLPPANIDRVE